MKTTHLLYECGCGRATCQYCAGGLAYCVVCKGGEGTLTTDCPGRQMTEQTGNAVWGGYIDFKDGRWVPGLRWWDGKIHSYKERVQMLRERRREAA